MDNKNHKSNLISGVDVVGQLFIEINSVINRFKTDSAPELRELNKYAIYILEGMKKKAEEEIRLRGSSVTQIKH